MFSKIDITDIFCDHINTLKNSRTKKISFTDLLIFFISPLFISSLLLYKEISINSQFATVLLACFSIFTALLFNLLLLIFDIASKVRNSNKISDSDLKLFYSVLKEVYVNVSFCISISVIVIVILSGFFIGVQSKLYLSIISFFSYAISLNFMLTLLMILKRIYRLLTKMTSGW